MVSHIIKCHSQGDAGSVMCKSGANGQPNEAAAKYSPLSVTGRQLLYLYPVLVLFPDPTANDIRL